MKVFRKITWETMKQNRTRTIVTVIGVILSATLFTAVTVFCGSLTSFLERTYIYSTGNYHISAEGADAETVRACQEDSQTELLAKAQILGYAEIESQNQDKPYLYVEAADDTFFQELPVHLTEGRLPENGSEILLPEHLEYNGNVSYSVGDQITLQVGERVLTDDREEKLGQHNPWLGEDEMLADLTEENYTVCGFYERPDFENYSAPGYTALTRADGSTTAEGASYDVYVKLKNPAKDMDSYVNRHFYNYGVGYNSNLLMFSGIFQFGNYNLFFTGMVLFFIALIFAGSVSLIYSAFSISVSERTRQFGLLSSVGATKRQIRRMVWQESLIVSGIGIPCGIAVGIAGIGITLRLLGDRFQSLMSSPYRVTLTVSWKTIGAAAVIALFTVLISVLIPSARASKVSAIEAIRQSRDVTAKGKEVKAGKIFFRLFGLEGMLGKKYFSRSRKKYRNTIVSLAFSVVLFITANGYVGYLRSSVAESTGTENYDLVYNSTDPEQEIPAEELRQAAGVKQMAWSVVDYGEYVLKEADMAESYRQYLGQMRDLAQENEEEAAYYYGNESAGGQISLPGSICYLDEDSYAAFVREHNLDEDIYLQGETVPAIVINSGSNILYLNDSRYTYSFDYLSNNLTAVQKIRSPQELDGWQAIQTKWCRADMVEQSENPAVSVQEKGETRILCEQYVEDPEQMEFDEDGLILDARNIPVQTETVELGDFVSDRTLGIPDESSLIFVYPCHMMPEEDREENSPLCYFTVEDHDLALESIQAVLEEHGFPVSSERFQDLMEAEEDVRNLMTIINVFSYGFIILISLISVANVFNAISTNISLRRRDFAMLKSVGMTDRGLRRMLKFECLIYGSRALAWGLPIGLALEYLVFRITGVISRSGFWISWQSYVIAAVCVFAVVFVSMRYAMSRIRMENPIEALKEEN